jgi:hypothetical protein
VLLCYLPKYLGWREGVLRREKEPVTDRVGARAKIDEEIKISYLES